MLIEGVIEYQVERDPKAHPVQPFLAKAQESFFHRRKSFLFHGAVAPGFQRLISLIVCVDGYNPHTRCGAKST